MNQGSEERNVTDLEMIPVGTRAHRGEAGRRGEARAALQAVKQGEGCALHPEDPLQCKGPFS